MAVTTKTVDELGELPDAIGSADLFAVQQAGLTYKVSFSDLTDGLSGLAVATFDANSIVKADVDNTPIVMAVAEDRLVGRSAGGSIAALTAAQVNTITGAAVQQSTVFSALPRNGTITLVAYALKAFTINQLFGLATASGTIDVTIAIDGVAVTGLSGLTASSTAANPSASGANTVSVGEKITVVLANYSSAVDLEFVMKTTT